MKYLFSKEGTKLLEALTFTDCLYAFDFDGTLAPIVKIPKNAQMSSVVKKDLIAIMKHFQVAIISGRSIADLKRRIDLDVKHLIGNHGLEGPYSRVENLNFAQEICREWKNRISAKLEYCGKNLGIEIEDKTYSVALHYRNSRNKKEAKKIILEIVQNLNPSPRIILGKSVVNVLAIGSPHKGVAVLELMLALDLKCAFYIGDDDTDEDVFSLSNSRIITVRVGKKKNSQAQYFIKNQLEIKKILTFILETKNKNDKRKTKNKKNN